MRRLVAGLAAVAALIGSAGCGSSPSQNGATDASPRLNGTQLAQFKTIEAEGAAPKAFPPLPKSPPAAQGKFVVLISCALSAEGCAQVNTGLKAAAQAIGWRELTIDTGDDPSKVLTAFEQAQNLHPDGIVVNAIDVSQIKGPIATIRALGIPVVSIGCGMLDNTTNANPPADGPNHEVVSDVATQGRALAANIALESEGAGHVLVVSLPSFAVLKKREDAFRAVMSQCAGCKISKTIVTTIAALNTTLGPQVKASLQADPTIKYVWAAFGGAGTVVETAIQQLGRPDIHVWTHDGTAQNLASLRDGGVEAADAISPLPWLGWSALDNLNRVFNNESPVDNDHIPATLVTKDEATLWMNGHTGGVDYAQAYKTAWGK
jgi:ribose transport system substrate-binding protein